MTRASLESVRKLAAAHVTLLFSAVVVSLAAFASPTPAAAESTINCPTGTYDMLDWMTMDSDLRSTYHLEGSNTYNTGNALYTVVWGDKFWWIKTGLGYPWDIQLYDQNYIYLWVTELSWTAPMSYKKFTGNKNLPLVPRCATAGSPGSAITVPNTSYDLHTNCSESCSVTLGLESAVNEVWGPYTMTFGGDLPANLPTLVISYRYNCDSAYQICRDKEDYYVTQRYGMVQWDIGPGYLPPELTHNLRRRLSISSWLA